MNRWRVCGALAFAVAIAWVSPVAAQVSVGTGVDYLGYEFDDGLGAESAQLMMVPVAVRFPATSSLTFDVYSAWAEGRVRRSGETLKLSGPVDTGVRAAFQATPWALVTLGTNLPTGNSSHDTDEAIVASVLSTDLLGFREASFGRGFAVSSSLALARQMGSFGMGVAGAYSLRTAFKPDASDTSLEYTPGSEARVRVGVDRNFGNSTFTVGGTFITYTQDQANGRNLFQAGNRFRIDASYAFRMGAGVWTVYAADLIRQNGDLALTVVDAMGDSIDTSNVDTPRQNLLTGGVMGAVGIGGGFVFRPQIDAKWQTRTDPATDSSAGSGWMLGMGGDIPVRLFGGYDFFPKARVLIGSIEDDMGGSISVFGLEFKGTVRFGF